MYRDLMRFSAEQLADALTSRSLRGERAVLLGPDCPIDGASFDSRDVRPGQLFVPIVAERDGHEFIGAALANGAAAYLTSSRDAFDRFGGTAILVRDTADALIDAAGWARTQFPASTVVIGITGSVGKTTTKDLVATALSSGRRVAANTRSFNNEQGLPVTILNAPDDTQVLVLEMGMRGFGQISDLCRVARPQVGVVTRVGEAHTELVGGIEGVAHAKGELIEALPPQGMAVLNADDTRVIAMAARSSAPVIRYGESSDADVRIDDLRLDDLGRASFTVSYRDGSAGVSLPMPGRHNASNAAAAIAVGVALGLPIDELAAALSAGSLSTGALSPHRMNLTRTRSGAVLLDDSYNANPTSMAAALETLAAIEAPRKIAFLGVMAEIDDPVGSHRAIAELAESMHIQIVAVGTVLYGVEPVTLEEAVDCALGDGGDVAILVKGSRVAGLDRLVDSIEV